MLNSLRIKHRGKRGRGEKGEGREREHGERKEREGEGGERRGRERERWREGEREEREREGGGEERSRREGRGRAGGRRKPLDAPALTLWALPDHLRSSSPSTPMLPPSKERDYENKNKTKSRGFMCLMCPEEQEPHVHIV
jgi:hypothetical protein